MAKKTFSLEIKLTHEDDGACHGSNGAWIDFEGDPKQVKWALAAAMEACIKELKLKNKVDNIKYHDATE